MKYVVVTALLFLIAGCMPGYQWSPYAEIQYRDEGFSPPGGASEYSGQTYMIGARAIPDLRLDELTITRLTSSTGNGSSVVDAERMGTIRADLAKEREKSSQLTDAAAHLEKDLAAEKASSQALKTQFETAKVDLETAKVDLIEAKQWTKAFGEFTKDWGPMMSGLFMILALIGFIYWTKRPKKAA